jgi:ATP-dependent Clp protease adaptor protein ClpS
MGSLQKLAAVIIMNSLWVSLPAESEPASSARGSMSENRPHIGDEVREERELQLEEPPMYKVVLLNDDYTTMDFVVEVLKYVFQKSEEEANRIMLNVHHDGFGICGIYPYEVAETKVDMVDNLSRERGFPLKCTMERD